jgi:hypothetical protein
MPPGLLYKSLILIHKKIFRKYLPHGLKVALQECRARKDDSTPSAMIALTILLSHQGKKGNGSHFAAGKGILRHRI